MAPDDFQEKALVPEILQVQNLKFLFPDKMFQTECFARTDQKDGKIEKIQSGELLFVSKAFLTKNKLNIS